VKNKSPVNLLARVLTLLVISSAVIFAGAGHAYAAMDNQMSLVDAKGRTMTIQQWDTNLNGVSPLDRNRLTREWFHSGRAKYSVVGAGAGDFTGTLEFGYQVSFPYSLGVGINFSYTTPNILLDKASFSPLNINPLGSVITPNLFPGISFSSDLGNGPGIQEIATSSVDVTGPEGSVAVANAHGTVTGAAGGVLLRPFARLTSKTTGDSVTTYGEPWNMN
jgi:hypothetical protein